MVHIEKEAKYHPTIISAIFEIKNLPEPLFDEYVFYFKSYLYIYIYSTSPHQMENK